MSAVAAEVPGRSAALAAPAAAGHHQAPVRDEALAFSCEGETLVGVLTRPAGDRACRTGVLIVVGGPQYRAGSHRHFVEVARELAQAGWPVLRFDVRGMGDSSGALAAFEQQTPDIGAAVAAFQAAVPGLQRIVLWGLCDGASASLLYLDERPDPRIAGLVLLNPWVRAADTYAATQVKGYYARRLLDPASWRELLRGRIGLGSLLDFARTVGRVIASRLRPAAPVLGFQGRMARAWGRFAGPTLLVLSENDLTAREFVERLQGDAPLAAAAGRPSVQTLHLAGADHTLSSAAAREAHRQALAMWLQALDAR